MKPLWEPKQDNHQRFGRIVRSGDPKLEKQGMKWLVCGGRKYSNRKVLFDKLDEIAALRGYPDVVIHGASIGADLLAADWSNAAGIPVHPFPADWTKYQLAAGPRRNQQMLDEGKPDLVIAFHGHHGTNDMKERARRAGVEVLEV